MGENLYIVKGKAGELLDDVEETEEETIQCLSEATDFDSLKTALITTLHKFSTQLGKVTTAVKETAGATDDELFQHGTRHYELSDKVTGLESNLQTMRDEMTEAVAEVEAKAEAEATESVVEEVPVTVEPESAPKPKKPFTVW